MVKTPSLTGVGQRLTIESNCYDTFNKKYCGLWLCLVFLDTTINKIVNLIINIKHSTYQEHHSMPN